MVYSYAIHPSELQSTAGAPKLHISCEYFKHDKMFRIKVKKTNMHSSLQLQFYEDHHIPGQNNTLHQALYKAFVEQLEIFAQKNGFKQSALETLYYKYQKRKLQSSEKQDRAQIGQIVLYAFQKALMYFPYTSYLSCIEVERLATIVTSKEHVENGLRYFIAANTQTTLPHNGREKWSFTCTYQNSSEDNCSAFLLSMRNAARFSLTCCVPEQHDATPSPIMHRAIYCALRDLLNTKSFEKFSRTFDDIFLPEKKIKDFSRDEASFMEEACKNIMLYFPPTSFRALTITDAFEDISAENALNSILRHTKLHYQNALTCAPESNIIMSAEKIILSDPSMIVVLPCTSATH